MIRRAEFRSPTLPTPFCPPTQEFTIGARTDQPLFLYICTQVCSINHFCFSEKTLDFPSSSSELWPQRPKQPVRPEPRYVHNQARRNILGTVGINRNYFRKVQYFGGKSCALEILFGLFMCFNQREMNLTATLCQTGLPAFFTILSLVRFMSSSSSSRSSSFTFQFCKFGSSFISNRLAQVV